MKLLLEEEDIVVEVLDLLGLHRAVKIALRQAKLRLHTPILTHTHHQSLLKGVSIIIMQTTISGEETEQIRLKVTVQFQT